MPTFLTDALPFVPVLIVATVAFIGSLSLHLEALRNHRARTADRQASSFVWRA
jgi:hypothetical protein